MTEFKIIDYGGEDWGTAVRLREDVLRKPLGQKFSNLELEEERNHVHIAGILHDKMVSTAVLVPENDSLKMQRVAVLEELRGAGIGSKMLHFCEEYGKKNDFKSIYCHARDSAVNFYLKNNFLAKGAYFKEDNIPHLKLIKQII